MLATVQKRASKYQGTVNPVILKHNHHKFAVLKNQLGSHGFVKGNCYYFSGLTTYIREYKAVKGLEFYKMAPILLNPEAAVDPEEKQVIIEAHCQTLQM